MNTALRLYCEGGANRLKPGVRDKKPGSRRSLSAAQEQRIRQTLCDKRVEQLKMDFALYAITSRVPVRTKAKLRTVVTEHMAILEANPKRLKKYFGDPKVAYAAS